MKSKMELLKTLPGVTVRKHEVHYPPYYNSNNIPSNVTVLNVLRPFSQQRGGSMYSNLSPRLVYSAGDSYIMNLGGDSMVRGDSIIYPRKPDPKPILKRNSPPENGRLFLDQNAAQMNREESMHKSPGVKRKFQTFGITKDNVLNHSEQIIPKTPSKNVTFKLENEDRRRSMHDSQWTVGVSRINKPLRDPRKIIPPDQPNRSGNEPPRRALTSEQTSRKYFLPLLLRRNANANHIAPATASPSLRRPQAAAGFNDRGPLRFRTMADEYRRTLNQSTVNKRATQRQRIST